MKIENINIGDKVIYIPRNLLIGAKDKMIKPENIGTVTWKNESFVFVQYNGMNFSEATAASDLFTLNNRPDLAALIKP